MNAEEISATVVDVAFHLHKDLGPGLLESVYEVVLARALERRGLRVERQKPVAFEYDGMRFDDGLRVDLLVNRKLVVELKSVEKVAPVHPKQLLTYLRLLNLPLGLLINFGAATFKEGCKRIVNGPQSFVSSCLRVNQSLSRRHEEHEEERHDHEED
ncbi:MAG: GxxExxY protein [Nitrospirae bacterium CG_4_10_14_3_um_filter_70_108]|nr:MAG: GxxExxY protein [Nitrospirae bacterium CG_4_10_14_3_um_filter_70_108]PJB95177.1 MAG: GxxExxY protein [Nitrospirae bacterium CG_4_9_14_0_8_um_filter_70_14]